MSSRRIYLLFALFAGAFGLLAFALRQPMLGEHEQWLERSYRNRWAYRDVPSRRGSILDRHGNLLASDRPGFDLEISYRALRRSHPVAMALHAANLYATARGTGEVYRWTDPRGPFDALRLVMGLPAKDLKKRAYADDKVAQNLRFYVRRMARVLLGLDSRQVALRLQRAWDADEALPIGLLFTLPVQTDSKDREAPHLEPKRWVDSLAESWAQLRELGDRLRAAAASARGGSVRMRESLLPFLEQRRLESADWGEFTALDRASRDALGQVEFWDYVAEQELPVRERVDAQLAARAADLPWPGWRLWALVSEDARAEWLQDFAENQAERDAAELAIAAPAVLTLDLEPSEERPLPVSLPPDERRTRAVARRLPYDLAAWFGVVAERHPGLYLRPSVLRDRPLGTLGQLVGRATDYWATDGRAVLDNEADDYLVEQDFAPVAAEQVPEQVEEAMVDQAHATIVRYYANNGRVGRSGVEASFDEQLSGRPGLRMVERDRRARELRMFQSLDVAPGDDVQLTVDRELQQIAESLVRQGPEPAERALVALDPHTGEILALAGFGPTAEDARGMLAATYPSTTPHIGSVVKPLVLVEHLDALRKGRPARHHSTFGPCTSTFRVGNRVISCDGVHGALSGDPVEAIARSCNVFFYEAVQGLGSEGLARALGRFGIDPRFAAVFPDGTEQPEVLGLQPGSVDAIPRHEPARFVLPLQGIGYGVNASALRMARAYAGLATGALPQLSLVRGAAVHPAVPLQVHPADLQRVRNGMRACVLHGTARPAKVPGLKDFLVFGKTGTAEVGRDKNNAWFACFVGEGAGARMVVVGVAYKVSGHGADDGGRLVADFLHGVAASSRAREYLGS